MIIAKPIDKGGLMFEVKIYKPVEGGMILKVMSGEEVAKRTFDREMSTGTTGQHLQLGRWRTQAAKPHVKCLGCSNTFRKIANRKFCSEDCGNVYRHSLEKNEKK